MFLDDVHEQEHAENALCMCAWNSSKRLPWHRVSATTIHGLALDRHWSTGPIPSAAIDYALCSLQTDSCTLRT